MFFNVSFKDKYLLECELCGIDAEETFKFLKQQVVKRYVDCIIKDIGLVITILELRNIEPIPILINNDGRSCYKFVVDAIIFKPVENSIIIGTIVDSDIAGIKLKIANFQDVKVPSNWLPENTIYDSANSTYSWNLDEDQVFTFETGSICRFKVIETIFNDEDSQDKKSSHMTVIGSMVDSGLGPCHWWN